jgi:serine/threonine-protein kinase
LLEIAGALELAHSHGWVHRDIKPSNVMVGTRGEIYLVDWGIATQVGTPAYRDEDEPMPVGTPCFMAPEMVAVDGVIDERTDVYLMGACLHHVLVGLPPHRRPSVFAAVQSALAAEPPSYDDSVPEELASIARRAMAREPERRFPSARAFRDALAGYLRHHGSVALAREGDRSREAFAELLASLGDTPEGRPLVEVHRAFAEARFAYVSAVKSWPENPLALRGLDELLREMIHHELAHGSVDAAAVLLGQLPEPDSELAGLVEKRRSERDVSARRLESLLAMERELDVSVGWRERLLFFLAAAMVGSVSVLLIVPWGGGDPVVPLEPRASIVLVGVVAVGLVVALAIGRRWLLHTAVNRRIVAFMFLSLAGVAANRWFGGGAGVEHSLVVTNDLVIETVVGIAAAIAVDRRLAVLAAGFALGVIGSRLWPHHYVLVFLVSNVVALAAGGVALSRVSNGDEGGGDSHRR